MALAKKLPTMPTKNLNWTFSSVHFRADRIACSLQAIQNSLGWRSASRQNVGFDEAFIFQAIRRQIAQDRRRMYQRLRHLRRRHIGKRAGRFRVVQGIGAEADIRNQVDVRRDRQSAVGPHRERHLIIPGMNFTARESIENFGVIPRFSFVSGTNIH